MEWRDVPRFEDKYQVSSEGDVYSKSRILPDGRMWLGRPRKFQPGRDGHLYIDLHHDAKNKERFAVHQLVMLAFRGKPEGENIWIKHLNGNLHDNRLVNLAYVQGSLIHPEFQTVLLYGELI